jgi:hypothetical protein
MPLLRAAASPCLPLGIRGLQKEGLRFFGFGFYFGFFTSGFGFGIFGVGRFCKGKE